MICRKFMALSLLPVSLVFKAFDDILDLLFQAPFEKHVLSKRLFDYFENQWIKNVDLKL